MVPKMSYNTHFWTKKCCLSFRVPMGSLRTSLIRLFFQWATRALRSPDQGQPIAAKPGPAIQLGEYTVYMSCWHICSTRDNEVYYKRLQETMKSTTG